MANWNNPTLASLYEDFLDELAARDVDAATLFVDAPTNQPEGSIRYVRASNKFQESLSSVWTDKLLSLAGGGTGAATASDARTNLGLGTMATQNANAVAITGGTISVTTLAGAGSGITALNASNLASGTVPTARLGSGTANNTTFLRGDQTWAAPTGTVPSGLIAMFDVSCPVGWTRFAALDGLFPRGASSYGGTGGADTHSHGPGTYVGPSHTHTGPSHTHAAGTLAGPSHTHSFSGTTSAPNQPRGVATGSDHSCSADVHTHTFSGTTGSGGTGAVTGTTAAGGTGATGASGNSAITGTSETVSNVPSYLDVVWCQKD